MLLLDEPTQGVDLGARAEIYRLMREITRQGGAILMISSDLPELLGMSHRIVVMRRGELVADLSADRTDQEEIMRHAKRLTAESRRTQRFAAQPAAATKPRTLNTLANAKPVPAFAFAHGRPGLESVSGGSVISVLFLTLAAILSALSVTAVKSCGTVSKGRRQPRRPSSSVFPGRA